MPRLLAIALALVVAAASGSRAAAGDLSPTELLAHECGKDIVGPAAMRAAIYRPDVDDPASLGAHAVSGVRLAYQCGSDTDAGAHVPEGWRVDVFGACADGLGERGTAVLVLEGNRKVHVGSFQDRLGAHELLLGVTARENLTLRVSTRLPDGERLRAARYLLVPSAAEALAASCALPAGPARGPDLVPAFHAASRESTIN